MQFEDNGRSITLQGIQPPDKTVQPAPLEQILKWGKRNDIWAIAMVEQVPEGVQESAQQLLNQLLQEYKDVFEEPKYLPPHRFYDHQIPLVLE